MKKSKDKPRSRREQVQKSGHKSGNDLKSNSSRITVNPWLKSFKRDLLDLGQKEREGVKEKLKQLQQMTWQDLFNSSGKGPKARGFNLEKIKGQTTAGGHLVFSIRLSSKLRARVIRIGSAMVLVSLHPDHDSAYSHRGGDVTEPLPTESDESHS